MGATISGGRDARRRQFSKVVCPKQLPVKDQELRPRFNFLRSGAKVTDKIDYVLSHYAPTFSHYLKYPVFLFFDLVEFARFGSGSPKKYELIHVKTKSVELGYRTSRPHHFGVVRDKYWESELVAVDEACDGIPGVARRRVEKNEPWEVCGELERVLAHRGRIGKSQDPEDPDFQNYWNRRYPQLDLLIQEVKETGRLRTRAELLTSRRFREQGGIGICLDSGGRPILTDGHHRFGIMKGLQIEIIPVALHAIHPDFFRMPEWRSMLTELRVPRS
jgi:hypothetical protein